MDQSRLLKLRLLSCEAAASQDKVAENLSQLMRLVLLVD